MQTIFSGLEDAKQHIAENSIKLLEHFNARQLYIRQAIYKSGSKEEFYIVPKIGNADILCYSLFGGGINNRKELKQIEYNNDYKL